MFGTAKPMASLSSGLLARKGQAKPAMRPQGLVGFESPLEDLGWNDLGEAVQPLTPQIGAPAEAPVPPVIAEREALAREVQSVPLPIEPAALATIEKAAARTTRAAFTLRLDADRHLRLRLASAIEARSAQQIVTAALDRYLDNLAEVDALAAQLRSGDGTR